VILIAFFALVAYVLEQAFQKSAEQALMEKLQVQVYSLLSVAEMDNALRLKMPPVLREPRFENPGSGLYAEIRLSDKTLVWRSRSAIGIDLPVLDNLQQGEFVFLKDRQFFVLQYSVLWESQTKFQRNYIFVVAEDGRFLFNQVAQFRMTLMKWLSGIGLLLIFVQLVLLHWGLKPLRQIGKDLALIEVGEKEKLDGRYPTEIQVLVKSLNGLVSSERAHLERYRNTLADLAHSLKTPLAIIRGCLEERNCNPQLVHEQVSRMNEIVEYQLQKAAAKGQKKLTGSVNLCQILDKIIASLKKVYQDKNVVFELQGDGKCRVFCEEGDLYEVAGNLLDNAAKWCKHHVKVTVTELDDLDYSLLMTVEDDGPGIAPDKIEEILQRGVRADENIEGHGIGMAVVRELVTLLGGRLQAEKSQELGGIKWLVFWP